MKSKKEQKAEVIAVIILVILIIISIFLLSKVTLIINKLGVLFLLIVFAYLFIVLFINYCYSKRHSGFIKIISLIFSLPLLLVISTGPIVRFIADFIFYIMFSIMIPVFMIALLNKLSILVFSQNTNLFLILTVGSIISITFNNKLLKLVYILRPLAEKISGKIEVYKAPTEYFLKTDNIRFIIYAFYFIYLFVYSLRLIEEKTICSSYSIDNSIMQAFVVFLAYDSLICNSKDFKIKASQLLNKLIATITVYDNENDEVQKDASD